MATKKKKRSLTLLEIMIVIVLIGLIGSVIGVNMKGSLEEGKAFKSRQAREQIQDILTLAVAQGSDPAKVVASPEKYLALSGLVKDPEKFIKDGWKNRFDIKLNSDGEIDVSSAALKAYDKKRKDKLNSK